jgi:nitrite reductase (NO-forming)
VSTATSTTSTRTPAAGALTSPPWPRREGAAAVRIGYGLLWAVDASFKWLPGFIHGQTLGKELGKASNLDAPMLHPWFQMWNSLAGVSPGAFAVGTAIVETLIALGLIFGAFSNLVFLGSAVFSFGIWSTAEAFHLPWSTPGITDLGPSVAYIFASLALFYAAAGSAWSLDRVLRPKLGRLSWLASPVGD